MFCRYKFRRSNNVSKDWTNKVLTNNFLNHFENHSLELMKRLSMNLQSIGICCSLFPLVFWMISQLSSMINIITEDDDDDDEAASNSRAKYLAAEKHFRQVQHIRGP